MNIRKTFLFCLTVALFFITPNGWACTTFNLQGVGFNLVGHNYDWPLKNGLLVINKRGVSKVAMLASKNEANFKGHPAQWTSRYGSVTFNQYGRELAHGGMNEAGLVIEGMALYDTIYPKTDSRPFVHRSQWAQYQLDNFKTVEEVINNDSKIRISPIYSGPGTHFMVSDRAGKCANIEFLNGIMIVHTGPEMPVRVLANDPYAESLEIWKNSTGAYYGNRFVKAANRGQKFKYQTLDTAVETAFDILHEISQSASTKWSIIFDIENLVIHYRTYSNPNIRYLNIASVDFSCKTPAQVLDINKGKTGNIKNRFIEYTFQNNRNLMKESFEKTAGIAGSDHPGFMEYINKLARYPDTTTCQ